MVQHDVVFYKNNYQIKGKDRLHGAKVDFYTAASGHRYFEFDGDLFVSIQLSDSIPS